MAIFSLAMIGDVINLLYNWQEQEKFQLFKATWNHISKIFSN